MFWTEGDRAMWFAHWMHDEDYEDGPIVVTVLRPCASESPYDRYVAVDKKTGIDRVHPVMDSELFPVEADRVEEWLSAT